MRSKFACLFLGMMKFSAVVVDKFVQRVSLKEKREAFKKRAAGAGKPEIGKAKEKTL